jgi:hypothetical protein
MLVLTVPKALLNVPNGLLKLPTGFEIIVYGISNKFDKKLMYIYIINNKNNQSIVLKIIKSIMLFFI